MLSGVDKARSKFRSFVNEPFAPVTGCLLMLITLSYSGGYVTASADTNFQISDAPRSVHA